MKIGFIGMGNMAQALCAGFIKTGLVQASDITAFAPHREKLEDNAKRLGFRPVSSLMELAENADALFVACKPYQIEQVLPEIGTALAGKALISIAAGWTLERYELLLAKLFLAEMQASKESETEDTDADDETLIDSVRVQCIMPNTPAMVGEGVFLFEADHTLTDAEHDFLTSLFSQMGMVHELPGHLMAVGTALTGCSPAFVDMMIEAYADAAVKYGIPRVDAYPLIARAILGAAKLQLESGEHPGVLKDKVCSPAGTTIRGVQALEEAGFRAACMASIDAVMDA